MCIADGSINFLLNSEKVTFNVFNLLLNELTPPPSRYKNTFKLYIPVVTNCFILFPSFLFYLMVVKVIEHTVISGLLFHLIQTL